LALAGLCVPGLSTQAGASKLGKPLWTVDLQRQDGSQDWLGVSAYDAQRRIAFLSQDEIVVMRDSGTFSKPIRAHAYSLDAASGNTTGQAEWQTNDHAWVFATSEGDIVVNTEEGSALYSSGFKQVLARSEHSVKWMAPDGRVMATWYVQEEPRHGVTEFLDPQALAPVGIRFLDQSVESIAGDRIAYRAEDHDGHVIVIRDFKDDVHEVRTSCDARPDFVSDEVVVASGCSNFVVARRDGTVLFTGPSSSDEWFSSASRDGRRFVMCRESFSMAHWPSLRTAAFMVFDVDRKSLIATLKVPPAPKGLDDSHAGSALSPDGTQLAILSGGKVSLYRLP
jgi:hypothetical protein